jgi:hypothetical protein
VDEHLHLLTFEEEKKRGPRKVSNGKVIQLELLVAIGNCMLNIQYQTLEFVITDLLSASSSVVRHRVITDYNPHIV